MIDIERDTLDLVFDLFGKDVSVHVRRGERLIALGTGSCARDAVVDANYWMTRGGFDEDMDVPTIEDDLDDEVTLVNFEPLEARE